MRETHWRGCFAAGITNPFRDHNSETVRHSSVTSFSILKRERDVRSIEAGQPIFSEGEVGGVMYAVVEGAVNIVRKEQVLETIGEGGIFGELALLDERPRSASAIAATPNCKVAVIDLKRFSVLVQQTPFFAIEVMRVMAERLRRKTGSD